ncbi:aldose 1-epimerase family protein [Actinotalea sp.]|uniref:aldose 1-epimerase family protein n=1 Tax=Actinotalea sp. TaxID=1872145 RepID=UPI0035674E7E
MRLPGAARRGADRLVALTSPSGSLRATVDLRGGGLHSLTLDGEPLVQTYDIEGPAPMCSGAVLFPWPNRVRGGRWTHGGKDLQLEVTEPELSNANHGLVLDASVVVMSQRDDAVVVSTVVEQRTGYPFTVALDTTYTVADDSARIEHSIDNRSAVPAPVALGLHPYVRVGEVPIELLRLTVDAARHLPVDGSLIPVRDESVVGNVDLRGGPVLGRRELNACLHQLAVVDGEHRHVLTAPDGRSVQVWTDTSFGYLQVYVTDCFPDPVTGPARAIAIEPMTAAPDALNSGRGLRWLEPGERWDVSWGLRAVGWGSADAV